MERLIRTQKTKMWRYFIWLAIRFKIGLWCMSSDRM
jgi:hypothetical protein